MTNGTEAPRVPRWRALNPSLAAALLLLAAWVLLAFVFRIGAGWAHLPMAVAVILLVRRVVTGPEAW